MCLLHAIHPLCRALRWFTLEAVTMPRVLWAVGALLVHLYAVAAGGNYLVGLGVVLVPILTAYLLGVKALRLVWWLACALGAWLFAEPASEAAADRRGRDDDPRWA